MQNSIRTKSGSLSAYGFACGYVERFGGLVTIEHQHGVYHVKRDPAHHNGHAWETHTNITGARKAARRLAR